jgi:tetratricopeptide (TPR) repeat protein
MPSKQEDLRRAFRHSLHGEILYNTQEYPSALLEFQKALPIFIQALGKKHRNTIDIYVKLGETYQVLGNYETALLNFKNALRFSLMMNQQNYDFPPLKSIYEKIAQIQFKKGCYQDVYNSLEELFEILTATKGLNSLEVANCHENFGKLYIKIGQYEKAIHSYSKALTIKQKKFSRRTFYRISGSSFGIQ